MKKIIYIILIPIVSCQKLPTAQEIVNKAIVRSGVNKLKNGNASFTFRGVQYDYQMSNGNYTYARSAKDSLGNEIKDVLSNKGFSRYIKDTLVNVSKKKRDVYSASINSVIYFGFLPLPLNDKAVNKTYSNKVEINDKEYHEIKITFNSEGGGEDHEDVFYYWFDIEDYSLDYLAYSYEENGNAGIRFREAYNARLVNGIVIQDYKNFKPNNEEMALEQVLEAFKENRLTLLSLIELENVEIE